jgi:hypothetical protein
MARPRRTEDGSASFRMPEGAPACWAKLSPRQRLFPRIDPEVVARWWHDEVALKLTPDELAEVLEYVRSPQFRARPSMVQDDG